MYSYYNGNHIDLIKVNFLSITHVPGESLLNPDTDKMETNPEDPGYYQVEITFSGCHEPSITELAPVNDLEKKRLDELVAAFKLSCEDFDLTEG